VEATEALRGLIDAIILTPTDGALRIELKGNLAAMLSAATNAKRSPETGDLSLQVEMVAGARNQHYLQLWRPAAWSDLLDTDQRSGCRRFPSQVLALQSLPRAADLAAVGTRGPVLGAGRTISGTSPQSGILR